MYRYYCIMRPPRYGKIPHQALRKAEAFTERRYIPEIECMAWGWVEYENPLTPAVIAKFKLIAAPREDE